MGKEMPDGLQLLLVEVFEVVLERAEVRDVLEEPFRVDEILVHVAEVGQQHAAPEDEFVQLLGLGALRLVEGPVAFVQLQQEVDLVGLLRPREGVEEIVHRIHLRSAQGAPGLGHAAGQVFLEEQLRTPVRDDEAQIFNASLGIVMPRHLLKERNHILQR